MLKRLSVVGQATPQWPPPTGDGWPFEDPPIDQLSTLDLRKSLNESKGVDDSDAPGNADYPWDQFDSEAYLNHNYGEPHDLDRIIIKRIGRFFEDMRPDRSNWRALDVGSGTNLYPALAMLPVAGEISLWEHSARNVKWLEHAIAPYGSPWDQFWDALRSSAAIYRKTTRPTIELERNANVVKGSIFSLPRSEWDVGTMFFVAESITGRRSEFDEAARRFLLSLKPGAPFVAAFMQGSHGYQVGPEKFPAVAITERDIRRAFRGIASYFRIEKVASGKKFRKGYENMILVLGRRDRIANAVLRDRTTLDSISGYAQQPRPVRAARSR
jgi:hypothetical protein